VFATICILYCIPVLEAPRSGRQTKQEFFLKNPYVRRFPDEHKSHVGEPTNIRSNVAPGWLRDYVAYVRRPGGTDEHKGLRFIDSAWPTNVS
jgi:hypothetical protein